MVLSGTLSSILLICFLSQSKLSGFVNALGFEDDLDDHDEALDEYFVGLLEGLRVIMPIGFPEFGLPVLEPLTIDQQELNFKFNDTRLYLKVQNVSGEGLSSYKIPRLRVALPDFRMKLTVIVPSFKVRGLYRANGTALGLIPIKGHGKFRLQVVNLTINAALKLSQTGETVKLRIITINGDMAKFNSHFDNLLSDGNLSLVINSIIRTHARRFMGLLLNNIKGPVNEALGKFSEIIDSTIFEDFSKNR